MDIFAMIAEDKIKKAIKKGEFNQLPGKGERLNLKDDLPGMNQEIKMAYRLMKNAGYITDEIHVKKEIKNLEDLIRLCTDDEQKGALHRRLSEKRIRFNEMLEKRKMDLGEYEDKMMKKFE